MDKVELWFFALGLLLTIGASLLFYFLLYERPPAAFEKQKTIQVGSWEIHYSIRGSGPPLLLIHGIGSSLHCWHYLTPILEKRYQVIALDLPGFGRSSKEANANYGLDDQAERVEQFLDLLKVGKCFLVGNSMGATISLWLAQRSPLRFPHVVAIAPAANPKLVSPLARRIGFLARPASWMFSKQLAVRFHRHTLSRPERITEQHIDQTLNVYRSNPVAIQTFLRATEAIRDTRLLATTVKSRVLVLWGADDRLVPRWTIDKLMPQLLNGKLVVHPSGGHQLQEDEPEWTFEQMQNFLPSSIS